MCFSLSDSLKMPDLADGLLSLLVHLSTPNWGMVLLKRSLTSLLQQKTFPQRMLYFQLSVQAPVGSDISLRWLTCHQQAEGVCLKWVRADISLEMWTLSLSLISWEVNEGDVRTQQTPKSRAAIAMFLMLLMPYHEGLAGGWCGGAFALFLLSPLMQMQRRDKGDKGEGSLIHPSTPLLGDEQNLNSLTKTLSCGLARRCYGSISSSDNPRI